MKLLAKLSVKLSAQKNIFRSAATLAVSIVFLSTAALSGFRNVPAVSNKLSSKDRLKVFDQVWNNINQTYYNPRFNGVDWNQARERYRPEVESARSDEEFYVVLRHMVWRTA